MKPYADPNSIRRMKEAGFDVTPRPWLERAAELLEEHGSYCDYEAWEEWMAEQPGFDDDELGQWEEVEEPLRSFLYGAFCDAAGHARSS